MMCGTRSDWRKEWQHHIKVTVLLVGMVYSVYSIYYAYLRLGSSTRKAHPLQLSENMLQGDVGAKSVHEHVIKGNLPPDVTIVTAYFNLGKFKKGSLLSSHTPNMYRKWMKVFAYLNNPLIIFTDTRDIYNLFIELRQNFASNQSKIFLISRKELWSFSLQKDIRDIFHQPYYPLFRPNTVNENYSCVMHAKFELVSKVIREKLYKTKYLGWLDVGLFRDIASEGKMFPIQIPPMFDQNKIAYSEVFKFNPSLTPRQVIYENHVWVGGAMFLGRPEVLYLFTKDYMRAVRKLIDQRLMSTDQQVLYSMYLPAFNLKPRVDIQTYTTYSKGDWFYLGYMIKELWDRKKREATPLASYFLSHL